jgi:hypothetical protein
VRPSPGLHALEPRCVRLPDDQICVTRREDLDHGIDRRAERSDGAIHAIHALDGDEHVALSSTAHSSQSVRSATHNGHTSLCAKHAPSRRGRRPRRRGVDGLVVEQGIARLRHAHEEARIGV